MSQHVHILGICGTFMAGVALIAREAGFRVTGCDANAYPPMSTLLAEQGIEVIQGFDPAQLDINPDIVVVGNAMSRGNALVEAVLERGLAYTSGQQWLAEQVLHGRWVLAVAGTHGKTTTSALLAWLLEDAGLAPGFLIGGLPGNFGLSARLGQTPFFVIEADEYDTAFFDKRSKFVHYRPRTAVLNNLEFDHADIFDDLAAIQRQFHHLVRTVPGQGQVIWNAEAPALAGVLAQGCWSEQECLNATDGWTARALRADWSQFSVHRAGEHLGDVAWPMLGQFNAHNALAALAAARHAGVTPAQAIDSLGRFAGVRRRLEHRGQVGGVTVYDDFAHHPTAIAGTLAALRARVGTAHIAAIVEPRSNTMKRGVHADTLAQSLAAADSVWMLRPTGLDWDLDAALRPLGDKLSLFDDVPSLVAAATAAPPPDAQLLVMSNGGFDGIHDKLLTALDAPAA